MPSEIEVYLVKTESGGYRVHRKSDGAPLLKTLEGPFFGEDTMPQHSYVTSAQTYEDAAEELSKYGLVPVQASAVSIG